MDDSCQLVVDGCRLTVAIADVARTNDDEIWPYQGNLLKVLSSDCFCAAVTTEIDGEGEG